MLVLKNSAFKIVCKNKLDLRRRALKFDKKKKHKEMKIVNYLKESYDELGHKTSWPTMQELGNSVVVVSIASLIIAFIVFLMDAVFNLGMRMMFPTV